MFCAHTRPRYQVCVYRTIDPLVKVYVAEWLPFGEKLIIRLIICSLCIMSIFIFSYFPVWFRRRDFDSDCISSWTLLTFLLSKGI